jgi:hypothetical protein
LQPNEKAKATQSMNIVANFEHRASSSRGKHEGESSFALCDRLGRTRDNSQRQLPTDHDYAVPTREYQTDQSSLNLPRLLLALSSRKSKDNYKNTRRFRSVDTVTPYKGKPLTYTSETGQNPKGGFASHLPAVLPETRSNADSLSRVVCSDEP